MGFQVISNPSVQNFSDDAEKIKTIGSSDNSPLESSATARRSARVHPGAMLAQRLPRPIYNLLQVTHKRFGRVTYRTGVFLMTRSPFSTQSSQTPKTTITDPEPAKPELDTIAEALSDEKRPPMIRTLDHTSEEQVRMWFDVDILQPDSAETTTSQLLEQCESIKKSVTGGLKISVKEHDDALTLLEGLISENVTRTFPSRAVEGDDVEESKAELKGLRAFVSNYMSEAERVKFWADELPIIVRAAAMNTATEDGKLRLPYLETSVAGSIDIPVTSVRQALSCLFLGVLPNYNESIDGKSTPGVVAARKGFWAMFTASEPDAYMFEKFRCYLAYLGAGESEATAQGTGYLTVHRRVMLKPMIPFEVLTTARGNGRLVPQLSEFSLSTEPVRPVNDDGDLAIQSVFACSDLLGGALDSGCGQAEAMFCQYPEALLAGFVCDPMDDHEAVAVIGARQFSNIQGEGVELEFVAGPEDPDFERANDKVDIYGRAANVLSFIDPLEIHDIAEFGMETMQRELYKLCAGYSYNAITLGEHYPVISTGNWGGAGAGGDRHYRLLLQWAAASFSGRGVDYCAHGKGGARYAEFHKVLVEKLTASKVKASVLPQLVSGYSVTEATQFPVLGFLGYVLSSLENGEVRRGDQRDAQASGQARGDAADAADALEVAMRGDDFVDEPDE